jgi:hypothetical protein
MILFTELIVNASYKGHCEVYKSLSVSTSITESGHYLFSGHTVLNQ